MTGRKIINETALFDAIVREDFTTFLRKVFDTLVPGQTFVPGWSTEAIAHQLERVRRGEIRRLIINMPPRSLKSMAASCAFPAFVLGHDPTKRIICVSYSNDLSHRLSNDFRAVLGTPWYRRAFPLARISSRKDTESEIELTARGNRYATSVGGTLTGRGGDIIIIDDPLKGSDALSEPKRTAVNEWYANTLLSRLDDKQTGAIVIVMQRVHLDDLTGFVLADGEPWTVLSLPAIAEIDEVIALPGGRTHVRRIGDVLAPDREPRLVLDALQRQVGPDLFAAQYQQSPVPAGGAMIKKSWIKRYDALPASGSTPFVLQSWDTAAKGGPDNDWSVCTTWLLYEQHFYLRDVYRDRLDYPSLKSKVVELARRFDARQILVEEAGTAIALLSELNAQVRGLTGIKPDRDKTSRMAVASAKFEAGQVFLPTQASWLPEFEAELFAFPNGRHDDQVDTVSQALNHDHRALNWERFNQNLPEFIRRLDRMWS